MKRLIRLCFLCVAFLWLCGPVRGDEKAPAPAADDSHAHQIDAIMLKSIPADEAMPGAMVLVARNGKILFTGSYGLANVEKKTPFDENSVFDLASNSKQFTAVAVLMLVEHGKMSLDDDIHKYLPEIPPSLGRPIKVADVLHMVEGFHSYMDWFDNLEAARNEDIAKEAAKHKLDFPVGSKYEYSNTAYALLALVVQRVAREPFPKFMRDEIFKPLGMNHTVILDDPRMTIPDRVQGYTTTKKTKGFKLARDDTRIFGDGQVFTTAQDLLLWDKALREGTLLKPETLKIAYTEGKLDNGKGTEYGMGFGTSDELGKKWVWHTGSWTGTATYSARCLDDGLFVVVLSNNEKFNAEGHGTRIEKLFERGK
jgi:CubicO group peptidase (beta-lactamase class C family)